MRIFQVLLKNKNAPQNPKRVPLAAPRLPFALRDRVSSKPGKTTNIPCHQELQNLISKLAQNDYNQVFCQKEVNDLRSAQNEAYLQFIKDRTERRTGEIKPGNELNPIPLNKYLKKFPLMRRDAIEKRAQGQFHEYTVKSKKEQ